VKGEARRTYCTSLERLKNKLRNRLELKLSARLGNGHRFQREISDAKLDVERIACDELDEEGFCDNQRSVELANKYQSRSNERWAKPTLQSDDQVVLFSKELSRSVSCRKSSLEANLKVICRFERNGGMLPARRPNLCALDVEDRLRKLLSETLYLFGVMGGELLQGIKGTESAGGQRREGNINLTSKARTKSSRKAPFSPCSSLTKCWTAFSG
jgi:hypothetical protein